VKYADDTVLLAKEETVLQHIIDKTETLRRYEMWKKTKVTRISRQPSPIQNMISQTQTENVEYFNYLGSMITNDA
jgi:hypothetical protein